MSNSYGFDFLRTEHKDDIANSKRQSDYDDDNTNDDGKGHIDGIIGRIGGKWTMPSGDVKNKPDLEKQFDILAFLQAHPGSGCLAPAIIYKATGIDLDVDVSVAAMLQRNPKVRVERVPDPENPSLTVATYAYQAKYSNVRDRTSLLAQINRMSSGVPMRDLLDSYIGVEEDLKSLICAGDIISVYNSEDKDKILFPRGELFLVELDGLITTPKLVTAAIDENARQQKKYEERKLKYQQQQRERQLQNQRKEKSMQEEEEGRKDNKDDDSDMLPPPPKKVSIPDCYIIETDVDPRKQMRRGEAVNIGGQWFRVSSAVKAGVPLHEQPVRAQAPLSVVSLQDLSKRNESDGYIRPFSETQIPLDAPLKSTSIQNITAARMAREKLLKLSHGLASARASSSSGGGGTSGSVAAAQLTGSYAHASNPNTLASSFATSTYNNLHYLQKQQMQSQTSSSSTTNNGRKSNIRGTKQGDSTSGSTDKDSNNNDGGGIEILSKDALEKAAADINLALYSHARRHGCTKDVREMYLATRSLVPESDADLQKLLVEHKLLEPNEQMRRPRLVKQGTNVDNDGKPKKRRYYERKNQRMTNTHLEGTEIGAILARAAEKQKQGKSVGDGGM